jgi:diaminohydroxyphosphoribosylaminopyrimidine deaminase/5-amino-6-(5-phosphoribosylamino)uracil reductase
MAGAEFSPADRRFMRRALALAERGRAGARPNPVVGAVVVRDGQVLSEGFHARAGQAHGEVNALHRLGGKAPGATIYVNLEPCCHTGRTGPCTETLIAAGVRRVVVGCLDPNPRVNGRGVRRLRRAGIAVEVGCLEDQSRAINRGFFVWVRDGRPLVTLKVAATLDGFIAGVGGGPARITGEPALRAAHQLRATHDAVLVGAGTVLADDPRLTVRLSRGAPGAGGDSTRRPAPVRVVLDGRLRTPPSARVLRAAPGLPRSIVIGARGAEPRRVRALERAGAEVLLLPARAGRVAIAALLRALAGRDLQSLLVEGGAAVHGAFIDARLVDRIAFFVAPQLFGAGVGIAAGVGAPPARALRLGPLSARPVGRDLLLSADVAVSAGRGAAGAAARP